MSSIDEALAGIQPISLAGANALAELQTRVDRKYLVDAPTMSLLLHDMAPSSRVLDVDGHRGVQYHSTYFDTAELMLFRAAVQGRRQRYKVRSRSYGADGPCFLEVKAKGTRGTTVKSRVAYARHERDEITVAGRDFVAEVTGRDLLARALSPVLTTEYLRSTLIDPLTHTRMTFDRDLRCTAAHGVRAVLRPIIVETKSAGAPSAADQWLWRHHVRPTRISKFGTGLVVVRPELPSNKWHRTIARHWDRQPA